MAFAAFGLPAALAVSLTFGTQKRTFVHVVEVAGRPGPVGARGRRLDTGTAQTAYFITSL